MKNYKAGDIVLIKSIAGDCIPKIHVKLKNRIVVKPRKGGMSGLRKMPDDPGYSGWEAEVIFQDEIDDLRKSWSIPFTKPGEETFVFDSCIIKKPRMPRRKERVSKSGKVKVRKRIKKPIS